MADSAPETELSNQNSPEIGEQTAPETNVALDAVASFVSKWLAIAALSTLGDSRDTSWGLAQKLYRVVGGSVDEITRATKAIGEFCGRSFATARLVDTEVEQRNRTQIAMRHTLTPQGTMAAAMAGMLIKAQLEHPEVDVSAIFGGSERRNHSKMTPLDALRLMRDRCNGDFAPVSFIWQDGTPTDYQTIISLADAGVLDRISKHDRRSRIFAIDTPAGNTKGRGNEVVRMTREACLLLLDEGETRVNGETLMNTILTLFPTADEHEVWKRLSSYQPVFLKSELHPALSRARDKIAVRINPAYQEVVDQLLDDFDLITKDASAQELAIKYAQETLESPDAMKALLEMAFPIEPTSPHGDIPAPDYEGWHADRIREKPWRPELPAYRKPKIEIDAAMADAVLSAMARQTRMPISNKLLSRLIEDAAEAKRKSAG